MDVSKRQAEKARHSAFSDYFRREELKNRSKIFEFLKIKEKDEGDIYFGHDFLYYRGRYYYMDDIEELYSKTTLRIKILLEKLYLTCNLSQLARNNVKSCGYLLRSHHQEFAKITLRKTTNFGSVESMLESDSVVSTRSGSSSCDSVIVQEYDREFVKESYKMVGEYRIKVVVSYVNGIKKRHLYCPLDNCERRYTRMSHLKAHILLHKGIRPYVCKYQHCGARFVRSDQLKRHERNH